jgi:hypothetical protein
MTRGRRRRAEGEKSDNQPIVHYFDIINAKDLSLKRLIGFADFFIKNRTGKDFLFSSDSGVAHTLRSARYLEID